MAVTKKDIADALGRSEEDLDKAFIMIDSVKREEDLHTLELRVEQNCSRVRNFLAEVKDHDLSIPVPNWEEFVKVFSGE